MSRQIVSNQGDLAQIIDNRFTTDCRNPHRMLIVIELAPPLWLENYARSSQIKFISADTLADRADQISALLGQEHEILAHSLNEPMDAGLLAALAGTVTHSGVLILSWKIRDEPFQRKIQQTAKRRRKRSPSANHSVACQ